MCLWSGGVESTSLLKHLLETTDHEVVTHYIEFDNPEQRTERELAAMRNLTPMLEEIRPFRQTFSRISVCDGKGWPMDYVWQFTIGGVAMLNEWCLCMYRGRCAEDEYHRMFFGGINAIQQKDRALGELHWEKAGILKYVLPEGFAVAEAAPWHPLYEKSKGWHIRHLGKLFPHTWSCRKPVRDKYRCTQCHSCLEVEDGLRGTSYNPEVARKIAAGEIE
jgi:hypothetical protein